LIATLSESGLILTPVAPSSRTAEPSLSQVPQAATANVPPQNIEAEEYVLGAMMVAESSLDPVIVDVRLEERDFYRDRHRAIFGAIRELYNDSKPVDSLTVSDLLAQRGELDSAGGKDVVATLPSLVPAAGNARHYAEIVKQHALLRNLLGAAQQIQQSVHERQGEPKDLAERAERILFEVAHEEHTADFQQLSDILHREIDKLEELSKGDQPLTGTPTGFRALDALTGGFQPDNLIVIAARPSMGKSALVTNIAEHVALRHRKPVAFFSLEMSETELAHRFIASRARISSDKLRKGKVAEREWKKVVDACNELGQAPLWIDDSADLGLLDLRAKARRLQASQGRLGLVIVDYLQLMRAEDPRQSRVEQVGQMSRGLKILARELSVPVIALSQLSRAPEQRPDKRPILSDLRESGNIEQDSDLVAFIYRGEYYGDETVEENTAELIVAKHRNGPIGRIELAFLNMYPKFADLTREEKPVEQRAGEGPPLEGPALIDSGNGSAATEDADAEPGEESA
jgi:replicative DNA helicase